MNESANTPTGPPQVPFSPPPSGGGGLKLRGASSAALSCAVILVLLGVGAIVALSKAEDMFAWAMRRVENELLANVSAEVPVEVRSDFRNAFAGLVREVRDGQVSTTRLQRIQRRLLEVARKGKGQVTEEDLVRLSRALRGEGAEEPAGTADGSRQPFDEPPALAGADE